MRLMDMIKYSSQNYVNTSYVGGDGFCRGKLD